MGRGKPAEGHPVPLSEPDQTPDAVDCSRPGTAEDRPADLLAGHPDQDVPPLSSGRGNGEDTRMGGRRVRRLHAELTRTSANAGRFKAWSLRISATTIARQTAPLRSSTV